MAPQFNLLPLLREYQIFDDKDGKRFVYGLREIYFSFSIPSKGWGCVYVRTCKFDVPYYNIRKVETFERVYN